MKEVGVIVCQCSNVKYLVTGQMEMFLKKLRTRHGQFNQITRNMFSHFTSFGGFFTLSFMQVNKICASLSPSSSHL